MHAYFTQVFGHHHDMWDYLQVSYCRNQRIHQSLSCHQKQRAQCPRRAQHCVDEGNEEPTLHIPVECSGADEDAINLVAASTSAHRGSIEECMCGGGDGVAQGEQGLQAALCVKAEEANDQEACGHGNTLRSTD